VTRLERKLYQVLQAILRYSNNAPVQALKNAHEAMKEYEALEKKHT
jgi:hypothetical protein